MTSTVTVLFTSLTAVLGSASPAQVAAIEVPFSSGVGSSTSGLKRFFRNGCYEVVSEGGPGAGGKTRNTQAGCHLPREVSDSFQRLDLLASASGEPIVREGRLPRVDARGNEKGPRAHARAILVRGDGSRWVAVNDDVAGEFLNAINSIPSENQWHAKTPATPVGKGPQFVAVSATTTVGDGARTLQATLSADGRWWCHRAVNTAGGGAATTLRAQKLAPVSVAEGSARLRRILQGARPQNATDDLVDQSDGDGGALTVELVLAGRSRTGLFPKRIAKAVAKRFAAEMTRHSSLCALP